MGKGIRDGGAGRGTPKLRWIENMGKRRGIFPKTRPYEIKTSMLTLDNIKCAFLFEKMHCITKGK